MPALLMPSQSHMFWIQINAFLISPLNIEVTCQLNWKINYQVGYTDVISARRSAHGILNFPRIVMKIVGNLDPISIIVLLMNGRD
jgi:hypothetical protein